MSWFSLNRNNLEDTVAIIDVGSSSVGGAIAQYSQIKKSKVCPIINYSYRHEIFFDETLDFKRFISALLSTLETVIQELHKEAGKPIKHYQISLPSPLYISQTKSLKYTESKQFTVSRELIHSLASEAAADFASKHVRLYPELINDKTYVLENNVMQTKLNDYVINQPEKKRAEKIELLNHISLSSTVLRQKFEEMIRKYDHRATLNFYSYAFIVADVLRDLLPENNFLIVDIAGELTDIFLVVDDVLIETASFPLGRNYLVRSIASSQGSIYAEAESNLNILADNKANQNNSQALLTKLAPLKEEWIKNFCDTLASFKERSLISDSIYFIGTDGVSRLAATWLNGDNRISEFTLSNRPANVNLLPQNLIKSFCEVSPKHQNDLPLLLESLFYAKINKLN